MNMKAKIQQVLRDAPSVTVIGDVSVDLVMGPLAQWPTIGTESVLPRSEMRPGGSAGNAAMALRALGAPVDLLSAVGDDALGRWLSQALDLDGSLSIAPAATTISVALLDPLGERTFLTTTGHLGLQDWNDLAPRLSRAQAPGQIALLTGVFLLPRLRRRYGEIIACLQNLGYRVALDTGWPPEGFTAEVTAEIGVWVARVDFLLLNELEILSLGGSVDLAEAMSRLSGRMPSGAVLVAKLGAQGAAAVGPQGSVRVTPPARRGIFDTVGAGDAFNAGFLLACSRGADLRDALQAGCDTATDIISHFPRRKVPGAQPHLDPGEVSWPTEA